MDLTVLLLALPSLTRELEPSGTELLWIIDVYGFLLAGLLITMGTLGDRIGRRRLLLIGGGRVRRRLGARAFSPSAEMLIATRALLGVAGATLAPSTLSLIRKHVHATRASARSRSASGWRASRSARRSGPLVAGCCSSISGGARCSCSPCR